MALVAKEDSDGDGVPNETELLLGHNPGDSKDSPTPKKSSELKKKQQDFAQYLSSYRWKPLERVQRPTVPKVRNARWVRNSIDAFVAAEHEKRGLKPRPEAPKAVLLRRVYLDLLGLSPTLDEQAAFEQDHSRDAYEKLVDRLLAGSALRRTMGTSLDGCLALQRLGRLERRQQVRDSKPHIWRWRDWIVESLERGQGL